MAQIQEKIRGMINPTINFVSSNSPWSILTVSKKYSQLRWQTSVFCCWEFPQNLTKCRNTRNVFLQRLGYFCMEFMWMMWWGRVDDYEGRSCRGLGITGFFHYSTFALKDAAREMVLIWSPKSVLKVNFWARAICGRLIDLAPLTRPQSTWYDSYYVNGNVCEQKNYFRRSPGSRDELWIGPTDGYQKVGSRVRKNGIVDRIYWTPGKFGYHWLGRSIFPFPRAMSASGTSFSINTFHNNYYTDKHTFL